MKNCNASNSLFSRLRHHLSPVVSSLHSLWELLQQLCTFHSHIHYNKKTGALRSGRRRKELSPSFFYWIVNFKNVFIGVFCEMGASELHGIEKMQSRRNGFRELISSHFTCAKPTLLLMPNGATHFSPPVQLENHEEAGAS